MKNIIALLSVGASLAFREQYGANPIRKVVNLLQAMSKKVTQEGEKEEELYEKFVCYCKKNTGALTEAIAAAQAKIAQLETQVKEDTGAKQQVDEELKQHKQDRKEAEDGLKAAQAQREKEQKAYEKESGETGTNIEGLKKAIEALNKGLSGGAFLQTFLHTDTAQNLRVLIMKQTKLTDVDRESVTEFLSGSASAPGTSEIVGILKEMKDEFTRDLNGIVEQEEQRVRGFEELSVAKKKQIAAATVAIEQKTQRSGELAVKIVEGKNDLKDTTSALSEDEQFQINLRKGCATKEKEVNERNKTRSEELKAIADTIKILNDDDALDLFKKTLPSPGGSFLQRGGMFSSIRNGRKVEQHAANIIQAISHTYKSNQLDFIALALKGKKVDFTKVMTMIDQLVLTLGEEQKEDDNHKTYCQKEFDTSEDTKNAHNRRIDGLTHDNQEASTVSTNLAGEIKQLLGGIKALDKSVAEATEQRQKEHKEFQQSSSENSQALQLIAFAKNRLLKFYNPKLHKPPPARELSEEERVYSNFGGEVNLNQQSSASSFMQVNTSSKKGAPPPPPETFGAYSTKSAESGGVIAMIDMLSNDLKKDIQQAEHDEKDSQEEYEEVLSDSKKKRAADSKLITTKETAKAEADGVAQAASESLDSSKKELYLTNEYIANLHKSCDFLVENYDFRQAARSQEVSALNNAKAVLRGADYSLLETASVKESAF